jgi:hypothetical protein
MKDRDPIHIGQGGQALTVHHGLVHGPRLCRDGMPAAMGRARVRKRHRTLKVEERDAALIRTLFHKVVESTKTTSVDVLYDAQELIAEILRRRGVMGPAGEMATRNRLIELGGYRHGTTFEDDDGLGMEPAPWQDEGATAPDQDPQPAPAARPA